MRHESLAANWQAVGALLLTTAIGLLLCVKLFRWEKEEKMRPSAKLWLLAVLVPFVFLGTWQAHAKDDVRKIEDSESRTVAVEVILWFVMRGSSSATDTSSKTARF